MALDNIISDYELRADDFTLSQIFAYNLHSNPALIELRLKQLKAKVSNNSYRQVHSQEVNHLEKLKIQSSLISQN